MSGLILKTLIYIVIASIPFIVIHSFLEFDLYYPDKKYDFHNDYPLTGEKIEVSKDLLSNYQLQIKDDENFSLGRNKKRIPNLGNKVK